MNQIPIPALSLNQMRTLHNIMVDTLGIPKWQLIERAGRRLAELGSLILEDDVTDRPVVILVGRGQKGATGLACAIELQAREAWVQILMARPEEESSAETIRQLVKWQSADGSIAWADEGWELPPSDLIIEVVTEIDQEGEYQEAEQGLIELTNSNQAPVVSLAFPGGVNPQTGELQRPHIVASATLSLGLPLSVVMLEPVRRICGQQYLADIGIPDHAYQQLGIDVPHLFDGESIRRFD